MLTHRQLRYFVHIVEAGSFSLAAERLFVAQSALSRQVREMEQQLGVVLLERDTRSLAPTAAGRSLHRDAQRILAAVAEAAANAQHAARGTQGTVRLLHSSSVPLAGPWLAALAQHARDWPGVAVEVEVASSEQQAQDVVEGRADLGLARSPILRPRPGLDVLPLQEERLWALLPQAHPLAGRTALRVDDLRGEPFVATPHGERGGLGQRVAALCRAHGFEPRPAPVRSRRWTQMSLVAGGFGIAVVPASMARLALPGACALPLEDADATTEVVALAAVARPAAAQRLLLYLRQAALDIPA